MRTIVAIVAAVFVLLGFGAGTRAQSDSFIRVAGSIERVGGESIVVRPYEGGGTFEVFFGNTVTVIYVSKGTLADIKPGAFVGIGATPQQDGGQRAVQVTVFAESQRGLGEGFHPWDRAPNGTMTNGTIDVTAASVDGPVLTVKYRDGEQKIVIPSDATIRVYSIGDRSELKVGDHVAIPRARKKLNGTLEADRINVGRGAVILR